MFTCIFSLDSDYKPPNSNPYNILTLSHLSRSWLYISLNIGSGYLTLSLCNFLLTRLAYASDTDAGNLAPKMVPTKVLQGFGVAWKFTYVYIAL